MLTISELLSVADQHNDGFYWDKYKLNIPYWINETGERNSVSF